MSWVAVGVAGATLVGGIYSSNQQKKAAGNASQAQTVAAQQGIDEQGRQFDKVQSLLAPYVNQGGWGLYGQNNLIGINGPQAQQQAYDQISNGPQYQALAKQGEEGILANASATGGLRGGNTQAALAQFRPQLLNQLIDQQYQRYGQMTQLGQNSAAGVGTAALTTGNNVSNLLQQQGAAQAGGALAAGAANTGYAGAITGALGTYAGLGGFGRATTQPVSGYGAGYSAGDPYAFNGGNVGGSELYGYKGGGGGF